MKLQYRIMKRVLAICLGGGLAVPVLRAGEIHVRADAVPGLEDGTAAHPYRSITGAVRAAAPGDTVRVHPVAGGYRETVDLLGLAGGKAEAPIVIDGQGSELVGSDPVSPSGWSADAATGTYTRRDLRTKRFLMVDGRILPATKSAPSALKEGQWCEEGGGVYWKPPGGKGPEAFSVEVCTRANGVQISGSTAHLVVKNFNARAFWNDGYNIHGEVRAIEFYECNAREMGDEGFSAHGSAEVLLDGAVYEHCQNGVFNANTGGKTVTRNLVVRSVRGIGYGFTPRDIGVEHTLEGAVLLDCPIALRVGGAVTVRDVVVLSSGPELHTGLALDHGGVFERVAVSGENVLPIKVADAPGFHRFSHVVLNGRRAVQIRAGRPLAEVVWFESSAAAEGASSEVMARAGEGNRRFPLLSTEAFLGMLESGELPGPSPKWVRKARDAAHGE